MRKPFGRLIRGKREALLPLDPQFGLRQIAGQIGVEPSYLSKVERGLVRPPSEATVIRLAKALTLDPDELLAAAGKISGDVRRTILKRPKLLAALVRQFAKASDEAVQRVILRARRSGTQ
jgi:HTH-type transcriptional regulator, competence development regulator